MFITDRVIECLQISQPCIVTQCKINTKLPSEPYNNRELRDDNAEPQFSEEDLWSRVESSKFCPMFAGVNMSFHLYKHQTVAETCLHLYHGHGFK